MGEKAIYAAGIDKGEIKGREAGKKEGIKEVAKKMKEKNIAINVIEEITKLTKEEIEKL